MSFADTLMTPRIDAKIRSKMYKHRRSNFKDILRERFRNQVRANRRVLFEKMRSLDDTEVVHNTLGSYLREEIQKFDIVEQKRYTAKLLKSETEEIDFDTFVGLMKEIEDEFLNEQCQWILEEYRKEEEETDCFTLNSVSCPVCLRGTLLKYNDCDPIICSKCDLQLSSCLSLDNLEISLKQCIEEHSRTCSNTPQFSILKQDNSGILLVTCDACSLFCSLT